MTERVERKTEKKIVTNLTEKNGKIESNMIAWMAVKDEKGRRKGKNRERKEQRERKSNCNYTT